MAELVPEVLLVAVTLVNPATLLKVFGYLGTLQRYPDIQVLFRYSDIMISGYPEVYDVLSPT